MLQYNYKIGDNYEKEKWLYSSRNSNNYCNNRINTIDSYSNSK